MTIKLSPRIKKLTEESAEDVTAFLRQIERGEITEDEGKELIATSIGPPFPGKINQDKQGGDEK